MKSGEQIVLPLNEIENLKLWNTFFLLNYN
jgi:hypothetical protein